MLTLGNLFVLMVLATCGAWLWHSHGLRERALARVKQYCAKLDIELLDGNVALRRLTFARDANGTKRLARVYNFEFTVTGEQRHPGTITMFGAHTAQIVLAPYPFEIKTPPPSANVIEMSEWRENHIKRKL
ncbi:DUF3301 domain-containing protein [Pseudomonas sp. CCI3.2]|uniref:DUF3301 domain-containing protein n=1 Tax=unclassified Pseudomonas TaxID=196821 RepID=UPI002AC8F31D|nr:MULTISPECIES: DUF3301 domain-containing protein [unclassified Pseudomonas]MEB0079695.1 DUF3301 domain-containing protein [Pseudomonas sp. MH10out]MEB0103449.1 DUF3301 domain-containing protein [Pseudomonas sp. CCI3.2]MEB0132198.1 DUF3301 domain-containing protein [Pseudomonas sp. CCI2.4]MEB0157840.1 DUF3301 domain-containing protein [Pseudomonas sp. AH2 (2023)]MEB0169544.1 DUF3301 domain-containing protein [Pseudomonas sp. CCC4.4]